METPTYPTRIAIDGPAASGKSTIGQMLAERLDMLLIDTGCMYRAVTLAALNADAKISDEQAVTDVARNVDLQIQPAGDKNDGRLYTVLLEGQDVTWEIRSAAVDGNVSQVSAYPEVRRNLVQRQRRLAEQRPVVMVGRDIGTVVLPDAPVKLYITASAEERALRRWRELRERGQNPSYERILHDIMRRDQIDGNRRHSPLRPADDAVILNTTGRTPEAIVDEIVQLLQVRMG
ncbi:MAG: (d)CMP kinase [Candidatus Promineifilaceae bacterium]|nr:(d)CMP kinase [Candidatus Promineifilaceae bacterium]